jgi:hypothetical protein
MRLFVVQWLVAAGIATGTVQSSFIAPASSTALLQPAAAGDGFLPGRRVLLDAHNAYPDRGRYADRLEVALGTGLPVAIEQDLAWCGGLNGGTLAPRLSHETTCDGREPTLEEYFFARIAPVMDSAIATGTSTAWPLITLNLDFKTNEPEHHAAVWALLGRYQRWLTTAAKTADGSVAPLVPGPLLVLTGSSDVQEQTFHADVPAGERLRLFGAIHGVVAADKADPAPPRATPATNYRRWWNNPWKVVEREGQPAAGPWTPEDAARLTAIVQDAHAHGLWIRFYTLNGLTGEHEGWTSSYNFGSRDAAAVRWRAAIDTGVDFVATDQYAEFAALRRR